MASREEVFADMLLDRKGEQRSREGWVRTCEVCNRQVIYGRTTWDAVSADRSSPGHSPSCEGLAQWAVLEANGATTWDPPSGGGGGDPVTLARADITLADSAVTLATLTY